MSIGTILLAILMFSVLIFVHELGHFLAAKWGGMQVNEFSMGMGPALFQFGKGETTFSLRAFPIGGFCAVEGENEHSNNPRSFGNIKLSRRIIFVMAGAVMNLLLGLIILGFLSATTKDGLGFTRVDYFGPQASSSADLQVGDEILRMNNRRVRTRNDIIYEMSRDRDGIMDIEVRRGGEVILLPNVVFQKITYDGIETLYKDFEVEMTTDNSPWVIVKYTFNFTGSIIKQVWGSFFDLITGRYSVSQLSGPVAVTKAISEVAPTETLPDGSRDWSPLLMMISFITINLGIFNLLPIPALDGGRLLFLLVELIRRKPVSAKYEGWVHAVGFMLLIGLMIFVTFNDILKLF